MKKESGVNASATRSSPGLLQLATDNEKIHLNGKICSISPCGCARHRVSAPSCGTYYVALAVAVATFAEAKAASASNTTSCGATMAENWTCEA